VWTGESRVRAGLYTRAIARLRRWRHLLYPAALGDWFMAVGSTFSPPYAGSWRVAGGWMANSAPNKEYLNAPHLRACCRCIWLGFFVLLRLRHVLWRNKGEWVVLERIFLRESKHSKSWCHSFFPSRLCDQCYRVRVWYTKVPGPTDDGWRGSSTKVQLTETTTHYSVVSKPCLARPLFKFGRGRHVILILV